VSNVKSTPVDAEWYRNFVTLCYTDGREDERDGATSEERDHNIEERVKELTAAIGWWSEWRDVMTAPRGEKVLLLRQDGEQIVDDWDKYAVYNNPRFTHWQPLPAAPTEPAK
jgi:hypothetical protein